MTMRPKGQYHIKSTFSFYFVSTLNCPWETSAVATVRPFEEEIFVAVARTSAAR